MPDDLQPEEGGPEEPPRPEELPGDRRTDGLGDHLRGSAKGLSDIFAEAGEPDALSEEETSDLRDESLKLNYEAAEAAEAAAESEPDPPSSEWGQHHTWIDISLPDGATVTQYFDESGKEVGGTLKDRDGKLIRSWEGEVADGEAAWKTPEVKKATRARKATKKRAGSRRRVDRGSSTSKATRARKATKKRAGSRLVPPGDQDHDRSGASAGPAVSSALPMGSSVRLAMAVAIAMAIAAAGLVLWLARGSGDDVAVDNTDDALTDDALTDDALTDDALTDDALTDDALTDDALTDDALTDDALTDESVAVVGSGIYEVTAEADFGNGLEEIHLRMTLFEGRDDRGGRMAGVDQLFTAGGNAFATATGQWDERGVVATSSGSGFAQLWVILVRDKKVTAGFNVYGASSPVMEVPPAAGFLAWLDGPSIDSLVERFNGSPDSLGVPLTITSDTYEPFPAAGN